MLDQNRPQELSVNSTSTPSCKIKMKNEKCENEKLDCENEKMKKSHQKDPF